MTEDQYHEALLIAWRVLLESKNAAHNFDQIADSALNATDALADEIRRRKKVRTRSPHYI